MELEKLTNLAPIFKKSLESGYDCIELIYLNPDISFNDILKPFLEGNFIINEANSMNQLFWVYISWVSRINMKAMFFKTLRHLIIHL